MISFKEFLAEARMAPLYHGTSWQYALTILENNKIKAATMHMHDRANKSGKGYKDVVSLTRSLKFAKAWAERKSIIGEYVIFELDQQKLSHNYKLVPYNHFQDRSFNDRPGSARELNDIRSNSGFPVNQYEENVIGDITNLKKYITKIYYMGDASLKRNLKKLGPGIPLEKL